MISATLLLLVVAVIMSGIDDVFDRLMSFSPTTVFSLLLILLLNLFIVSFRFWRILAHFGTPLPFLVTTRAKMSGLVAGHFMITLFGQVMGQQAVLRKYGVKPVLLSGLSAYEHTIIMLVSMVMAMLGAIYLLGGEVVGTFLNKLSLVEILVAITGGVLLSLWLGRARFEKQLFARALTRKNIGRVLETTGITFIARCLMLLVYVLGVLAFKTDIGVIDLFAAAVIISLAASLPITVNGWGIREIAAIYVFGHLGVPAAEAMAVSVMVGLCSTLVIFFAAPFTLKAAESALENQSEFKTPSLLPVVEFEKIAAWLLGMAVAVFVFFQAHVPLHGTVININLADPFSMLALASVGVNILFSRRWPVWRMRYFNLALGVVSLILLLGFIRGWQEIGITQWALSGRLFGWLVLLGYLSAGYLVIAYAGAHGMRRLAETMLATLAVVVLMQAGLRLLDHWGLNPGVQLTPRFEGYAANRNAFSFQLLTGLVLLLGYLSLYARKNLVAWQSGKIIMSLLLGILILGLYWAGSRAGWGTAGILILGALLFRFVNRRILIQGIAAAVLMNASVSLVSHVPVGQIVRGEISINDIFFGNADSLGIHMATQKSEKGVESSDSERWNSYRYALDLWQQSPVIGVGLGVFIESNIASTGKPLIIHNSFLWLLAEFGLVGATVFCATFVMLLCHAWRSGKSMPAGRILLLLLVSFALFSLTHEILYQRIFWLVLGVVLAQPAIYARKSQAG